MTSRTDRPTSISAPCMASVYMTAMSPPKITYDAVMAANPRMATFLSIPNVTSMKLAPPMMMAAQYSGMAMMIMNAEAYCMNGESKRFPSRSGNVTAPSCLPIRRILLPKNTKAIITPTRMHRTVSHISPIPYTAEMPPKPTMAEVLMNAAP